MTTEIIVEKVDREAAADLEAHEHDDSKRVRFMSGDFDSTGSVQLFARHRLAERERVVAWLRDDSKSLADYNGHDLCIGSDWYREAADAITRGNHITTGQEEGA